MKRTTLRYLFSAAAFMLIGFEAQAMDLVKTREAQKFQNWSWSKAIPQGTLQERESKGDFTLCSTDYTGCITATYDKNFSVQLWDTKTGSLLETLLDDWYSWGKFGHFLNDGSGLIIQHFSKEVFYWIEAPKGSLHERKSDFIALVCSGNGTETATFDKQGRVQIWNAITGSLIETLTHSCEIDKVKSMRFSNNGKMITINYEIDDPRHCCFIVRDRKAVEKRLLQEKEADLDFIAQVRSSDGAETATIDKEGAIELWNTHTGQLIERVYRGSTAYGVTRLTFSPDETKLFIHYKLSNKQSDSFSVVRDFVRRTHSFVNKV